MRARLTAGMDITALNPPPLPDTDAATDGGPSPSSTHRSSVLRVARAGAGRGSAERGGDERGGGGRKRPIYRLAWPLRIERWLWRWRALLASLGVAMVVIVVAAYLKPTPTPVQQVVVARHSIAAGVHLSGDDLKVARVPAAIIPAEHFTDSTEVIGQVMARAVPADQVITTADLLGPSLADRAPAGSEVITVPLSSAGAMITPGRSIRLYSLAPAADFPLYWDEHIPADTASGSSPAGGESALPNAPPAPGIRALVLGWAPPVERSPLLSGNGEPAEFAYLALDARAIPAVVEMMRAGPITAVVIPHR